MKVYQEIISLLLLHPFVIYNYNDNCHNDARSDLKTETAKHTERPYEDSRNVEWIVPNCMASQVHINSF